MNVVSTWADVSKAKRLLEWRSQVAYDEGIERLVSWYQVNRAWAKEVVTL